MAVLFVEEELELPTESR